MPALLDDAAIDTDLADLPGWERDGRNHHPDMDIRWRTVTFRCSTHSEGGITQFDVDLAKAISEQVEAQT